MGSAASSLFVSLSLTQNIASSGRGARTLSVDELDCTSMPVGLIGNDFKYIQRIAENGVQASKYQHDQTLSIVQVAIYVVQDILDRTDQRSAQPIAVKGDNIHDGPRRLLSDVVIGATAHIYFTPPSSLLHSCGQVKAKNLSGLPAGIMESS